MTGPRRLGRAVGIGVALWAVVPVLLWRAAPGAPRWLVIVLGVVGLAAHLGCRLLSNRSWFSGPRSPVALGMAALAIAGVLAAVLTGVAVTGHALADTGDHVDGLLLTAAWATSTIGIGGAFSGRVQFRGWLLQHAAMRDRTRPFATAPIGPDRAAIVDLIDDLAAGHDDPPTPLPALARRLRLASDERFRRRVPWATARPLLVAAAEHAALAGDTTVHLAMDEGADDVPVKIGPIVDLVHELATSSSVLLLTVTAGVDRGKASITLTVASTLDPDQPDVLRISPGTARALDQVCVSIGRPRPGELTVTTSFSREPEPVGPSEEIEAVLSAPARLLAESPFSGGARQVYRRGRSVVKVQRHGRFDPKPTLLEDEFHLLRRLHGRSSRFPTPIGYGNERTFSWIAYDYVEGRTLDEWLAEHGDQAPTRLLSFGVDLNEILDELSACHMAHRDINPGNLIIDDTGSLVLIDFDQAASGLDYVDADRTGVDAGLAKNDLVEFLDRTGLTRTANELVTALDEAWPDDGVPFSLGVFGLRFGDGWPLEPLLSAARTRLGPLDGFKVLDVQRVAPIAGLVLASAGADVTAVVDEPGRWARLAELMAPRLELLDTEEGLTGHFDLTVALDHQHPTTRHVGESPHLVEWTGGPDERVEGPAWFTTTRLTQVGPAGS